MLFWLIYCLQWSFSFSFISWRKHQRIIQMKTHAVGTENLFYIYYRAIGGFWTGVLEVEGEESYHRVHPTTNFSNSTQEDNTLVLQRKPFFIKMLDLSELSQNGLHFASQNVLRRLSLKVIQSFYCLMFINAIWQCYCCNLKGKYAFDYFNYVLWLRFEDIAKNPERLCPRRLIIRNRNTQRA